MVQDGVDHAGSVEAGDHGHPTRHGRGLESADFLHPPHVPLDLHALDRQWADVLIGAPGEEQPEIGFGVDAGCADIATEIGRRGQTENKIVVM